MSDINDNLPSIEDYRDNQDELPSISDFITEEGLPSVEEFVEKKEEVEEIVEETIEEPDQQTGDLTEVLRLINSVRKDIPDIPEIKYYDEELEKLTEYIGQVQDGIPEVKYYDEDISSLKKDIEDVRGDIPEVPEVRYYEEDISFIQTRIDNIKKDIQSLPEVKYYEEDIESLKVHIQEVVDSIPVFPKWVNEVNEVPDFSWIGKTFSVIDDDFVKVQDNLNSIQDRITDEVSDIAESIEVKLFENKVDLNELTKNLEESKDKIYEELKEYSVRVWEHHNTFKDDDRKLKKQLLGENNKLKQKLEKDLKELNDTNIESQNTITSALTEYFNEVKEDISNLPEVKYYDKDIQNLGEEVSQLDERIGSQGININELYKIVEELKKTQENLKESTVVSGPDPKLKQADDPLTPIDQEFDSLAKLAKSYKLFTARIQEQLWSIGGGGAAFIKDLDDVTFDQETGGNKLLIYAGIQTGWIGISSDDLGGGAGVGGTWAIDSVGIHTIKSVGIGTTADSSYQLLVKGDGHFTGNISAAGTVTFEDVKHIDAIGVSTFRDGIIVQSGVTTISSGIGTVYVGSGSTTLIVDGDARITGILTVGRGSVTIDGDNNQLNVGVVTVTNSTIYIGDNVSLSGSASGINSAPNVLYVAKDGVDTDNGTSIDNAFLTIKAAVGAATSGTTIKVLSGKYTEINPIEVPAFVSIVGDDQRTVQVTPSTTTSDIFHVRKGSKLSNMTFKDHEAPAAAVAFPTTEIAENVGGGKWKGPYIQNCTSDTTTGKGIYIDGNQARLLKAMNVDSFTQYNQGGVGVAVTNGGFAQLVSLFTICCNEAVTVDKGGQADIANSNCSFGTYGLIARGTSELQYSGIVTSSASISQATAAINISTSTKTITDFDYHETSGVATVTTSAAHGFAVGMGVTLSGIGLTCTYGSKTYPYQKPFIFTVDSVPDTTSFVINAGISTVAHTYVSGGTAKIDVDRPYDGQLCYFDTLYKTVKTIAVGSGGTGYSLTPTVTVAAPGGPSGENATAYATLDGDTVSTITIISSGSQYESTPDITISGPDSGINTATATASMSDIYYTINSSTPVTAGVTTVTLSSNLLNTVGVGSTAYFYQGSRIVASSHTFEYVGAGNNIADATPKRGGVTVQANEVVTESGGLVLYTSTDQAGNFRIGDDLKINQETGTISGRAFSKSLFSEMTPFILALS